MTMIKTTTIRIDDPLGYSEKDVAVRVRHMAQDAVDGVGDEAVAREADVFVNRLRQAGKLPNAKRR